MSNGKKNVSKSAKSIYADVLSNIFYNDSLPYIKKKKSGNIDYDNDIWINIPPSVSEFFDKDEGWFKEPFYPIQHSFVTGVLGEKPDVWDTVYDEGHAFWGKGAGKDRTIAKMLVYVVCKLLHMRDPQRGLELFIPNGIGTIGIDSPIDIANVSKDEKQAKDVFFKNLKAIVTKTINPKTGKNFFDEVGCDVREGKDLQTNCILFPHSITCHSLNSQRYAGEGLNLFFVVADEIGASPIKKIRDQLTSIRETIASRFPTVGKLILMSFKYGENCAMSIEYKLGKKDKRILSSRHATYIVNPRKSRETFKKFYIRDPIKAMMTYECKSLSTDGSGFIRQKKIISWAFRKNENPFINDIISTENILSVAFKNWFLKNNGNIYAIHVDLAKGDLSKGQDSAGISMVHPELMKPDVHDSVIKLLKATGLLSYDDELSNPRKGVVVDFLLRLTAPQGSEIKFSDIITFIKMLKEKGFNIHKVTYDGYQSLGEIQRLNEHGIDSELLSVDKTTSPYDTLKDLLYMGLLRGYPHSIIERELFDLIKDEKGKIDHPDVSWLRLEQEGIDYGSKDVADPLAGSSQIAIKEIGLTSGICF